MAASEKSFVDIIKHIPDPAPDKHKSEHDCKAGRKIGKMTMETARHGECNIVLHTKSNFPIFLQLLPVKFQGLSLHTVRQAWNCFYKP